MFTELVSVIFRILNFAALVWLGWYLFKKYGLPLIKSQMNAKQAYLEELKAHHTMMVRDIRDVERTLVEDREQQDWLKEQLMRWRGAVEAERARCERQKEQRAALLQKRLALQVNEIQANRIREEVLPKAVERAREVLAQQYADGQTQRAFMTRIMTTMKGDRS